MNRNREPFEWWYTLNVRSRGKQLVSFSRESWCFQRRSRGKQEDSRENKTYWFPDWPDIKCCVIYLDFHFNSNKRITGPNQNSRLGTYNNTNLILKTTGWMIYKVPSLYYLHHFPLLAAVFLLVTSCVHSPKRKLAGPGSVFPAFCDATFHHALITCCNVARAGYIA